MAGEGRALFSFDPGYGRGGRYNHLVSTREPNREVFALAACPQLAENSRQGVPTSTQTLYRGFEFAISSTYMGLQFRCSETVSGPVVAPNNGTQPKQPTSPVVKLICQQQAKAYQAKFNAANSGNVTAGAVGGGMAGVGIGVTTTSSFFTPIAFAEWLNLKWNSALRTRRMRLDTNNASQGITTRTTPDENGAQRVE